MLRLTGHCYRARQAQAMIIGLQNSIVLYGGDQINLCTQSFPFFFADMPLASALVSHSVGIASLYLLQGAINLVGSPAGCRIHHPDKLEGLDMGSYLTRKSENGNIWQNLISCCRKKFSTKVGVVDIGNLNSKSENDNVKE